MRDGSEPAKFLPALESLRGIAALTVALYHISWRSHFSSWGFVRNGYLMVDFFFILSGFVICHSYGRRMARLPDLGRFLFARFGRLYPLHLATLLGFLVIEIAKWAVVRFHVVQIASAPFAANDVGSFVASLLLIQGLGMYREPSWNGSSWSISVEFWIYVLFGGLVVAARRFSGGAAWKMVQAGAAMLALFGLAMAWRTEGALTATGRFAIFRGLLGFFSGVLLWQVYAALRNLKTERRELALALAGVGLVTVLFLSLKSPGPSDFICAVLFAAVILLAALGEGDPPRLMRDRRLLMLGAFSYSIYMVHPLILWGFEFGLQYVLRVRREGVYLTNPWMGDLLALLYVAMVLAAARVTFWRIEEPGRLWAKRIAAK